MLTDSFDFYSKDVVLNKKLFYNYIKVNNGALIPEYTQIASDTFGGASFFIREGVSFMVDKRNFRGKNYVPADTLTYCTMA